MRTSSFIAVTVAAALAASAANAAAPNAAQANAATVKLYVAGSSALKNAFKGAFFANICGGAANASTFTSNPSGSPAGTADFNAYSCTATGGSFAGSTTTIYYRAEGGSVVGVYPVINNTAVKFLDLSSCPAASTGSVTCPVSGTSSANGPTDNWGAGTSAHVVELGISDIEPDAFVGNNSPIGVYSAAFTGPAKTAKQLAAIPHTTVVQQVFGMVINKSGALAGVTNLSKSAVANILSGQYANWNEVPAVGGTGTVTSTSLPIVVCNREVGSGTRAVSDLYFEQDQCNKAGTITPIHEFGTPVDNFSTSEEENCVNSHAGAIGYVGLDKFGDSAYPSMVGVSLDANSAAINATNLNAATGTYDFAFEPTLNKNATAIAANSHAALEITDLTNILQDITTTASAANINALPGLGSNNLTTRDNGGTIQSATPTGGTVLIYTTNFDRGGGSVGNSCNPLAQQ